MIYKVGDTVWYLSHELGTGMTRQDQVRILEIRHDRSKIQHLLIGHDYGKPKWVKLKNLRPLSEE